ncbi:uroporphyrinogen-III synthase [Halochromatium glycolicum]|jgi:uroporphyrinogen-III synthase|uniref:Uroporphyrinogen-III synthase n=1 Tax=Halochromatium glycolicum TaxID=85075 RepID=A0AAJ0U4E0_9GAMM|nr:uroporphyrinogen-III synthase [Halochromatium glycolicum]MBK1705071.1 hypothetical protein [Halochromatium glycolicum]
MTGPCRLDGCQVLVTRPAGQAAQLCELIRATGAEPVAFPTLEIRGSEPNDDARSLLAEPWDIILFVSRNAVDYGLPLLPRTPTTAAGGSRPLIGAVGRATAAALREHGMAPDLVPERGYDSEALLALPTLTEVQGRRVLIVRGVGGRAKLGESLSQRGAEVAYAEVYRRCLPETGIDAQIPDWQQRLSFITATSDEVLQNLCQLVRSADQASLRSLPLVVISDRGGATAMQLGFRTVAVAEETSDEGIVDALCRLALSLGRAH